MKLYAGNDAADPTLNTPCLRISGSDVLRNNCVVNCFVFGAQYLHIESQASELSVTITELLVFSEIDAPS